MRFATASDAKHGQSFAVKGKAQGVEIVPKQIEHNAPKHGEEFWLMSYTIVDHRTSPPFVSPTMGHYPFKKGENMLPVFEKIAEHYDEIKGPTWNIKISDEALRSCWLCDNEKGKVFETVKQLNTHFKESHS